jgi:hypothetical protein
LLQAMGEIAIFLGRFLQAVDDARASAAVAVTVLLGEFHHPLAVHAERRIAGGCAVFPAKEATVNVAAVDLLEVHIVGSAARRREDLKQENGKVPPQQRGTLHEIADRPAFFREFFLDGTDENAESGSHERTFFLPACAANITSRFRYDRCGRVFKAPAELARWSP